MTFSELILSTHQALLQDILTQIVQAFPLCDALVLPEGICLMEKRMVDVALRHGVNEYTIIKWKAIISIKEKFESMLGKSIYSVLPGVVECTFGFERI